KPDDQRAETSEEVVLELRPKILGLFNSNSGITLKLIEDPPGPPVFSTVQLRVQADDEALLETEARALRPILKSIDQVVDHDMTLSDETDDILIEVDHLACSRSKVDPAQVVDTLNTFFSSRIAGIYHGKNLHEQVYIVVR